MGMAYLQDMNYLLRKNPTVADTIAQHLPPQNTL